MTITRQQEFWTMASVKADPDRYYIFGDNEARTGTDGQACIRGLGNAFGVATKRSPSEHWNDNDYDANVAVIEADLAAIPTDRPWVISQDGLGTGLADLPNKAPRTYAYLVARITEMESECYVCPPGKSLVLRTCTIQRTGHHRNARSFVYPERGYVEAPDWDGGKPECGGKLHGLLNGLGDSTLITIGDVLWQVLEVDTESIIDLDGKIGFRSGIVIYTGDRAGASRLIGNSHGAHFGVSTQGDGSTATQGDGSTATQGDGSTATQGDGSTATQGNRSTATQGYGSTATQGNRSTATQGNRSTATQGNRSTATQGYGSTATQGDGSTATQGYGSTATQGYESTATQGYGSTATQGNRSTATQGDGSVRLIKVWDDKERRWRGYVAEVFDADSDYEVTPGAVRLDPDKTYKFVDGRFELVDSEVIK